MSCLPDTTFALQRGLSKGKCFAYSYLRRKIRAGTGSLYRIRDCRPGVGDMMTKHPNSGFENASEAPIFPAHEEHSLFREGEVREKCLVFRHLQRNEVRDFPPAPQKRAKLPSVRKRVPRCSLPGEREENMIQPEAGRRMWREIRRLMNITSFRIRTIPGR
jgi:hypothetical protein